MNEDLFVAANWQLCDNLRAIKKSGEWNGHATFYGYTQKRWGLSKTRTKLLLNFSTFGEMCRESRMRLPDTPECALPILSLPQKSWLDVWRYCVDCASGPITQEHCRATMERFGIVTRKKLPQHVLDTMAAKKGAKNFANIQDISNVKTTGPDWDQGVHNMIEIDQRRMNK